MIKIAIVEDHQMVREGLRLLINQNSDMEIVAEFSNGNDWLQAIQKHQFDVSLIDIDMPVVDGLTTLSEGLRVDSELKVIMLTMHNDVNYLKDAFVKGAKGFVQKDMSVNELSNAIQEVNLGHTYFSDDFLKSVAHSLKKEKEINEQFSKGNVLLSESEHQLITHICQGYTNKELSESLFLSVKAIESQKTKLMRKTGTKNNAGLIVWAVKNQVVKL